MAITIRTLDADEWREWRDLRFRALADSPDSFAGTLEDERIKPDHEWTDIIGRTADHPRGNLWFAEQESDKVGMMFGRITEDFDLLEIGAMWVAPETRRRGAGRLLLQAAFAWAHSQGVPTADLWVTEANTAAVAFYEAAGFTPTTETKKLREGSDLTIRKMMRSLSTDSRQPTADSRSSATDSGRAGSRSGP